MSNLNSISVRVQQSATAEQLRLKAAKTSVKFLRAQAEARLRTSGEEKTKESLCRVIWELYTVIYNAGAMAHPTTTRALIRSKYGFWAASGADSPLQ